MLREAIAAMLGAQRGMVVRPEHICITRGSQMAVTIVARALVERGDIVVMERLSYSPAAVALAEAGARIVTVGLDAQGIDVEEVEALCKRHPVRAIRSEEHTSELQSLMRISYAVFCLKKKTKNNQHITAE